MNGVYAIFAKILRNAKIVRVVKIINLACDADAASPCRSCLSGALPMSELLSGGRQGWKIAGRLIVGI